jgi:hypothetical protein
MQTGHFNQTGKHYHGHFATWLCDEIVEIAAELGVLPSFPIPSILATCIETPESFGIIPLPESITSKYRMH